MIENELINKVVLIVNSIDPSMWNKHKNCDAYCYVAHYNGMRVELVNPPGNYNRYVIFDGLEFIHEEFHSKIQEIEDFIVKKEEEEINLKRVNLLHKLNNIP